MRTQFMPSLVGAFVLIGLLILIGFVLYRFEEATLEESEIYVMYFEGSMEGLEVGAEVTYRGIKVGEVIDIGLEVSPKTNRLEVPVYIQLLEFRAEPGQPKVREFILKAIDKGLRAQLYATNIVTGSVAIRLVDEPDEPSFMMPPNGKKYVAIPTIAGAEREFDIQQTLDEAEKTFKSIRELTDKNSPKLTKFLDNASTASDDAKEFMSSLNAQIGPTTSQANQTLNKVGRAASAFEQLGKHLERHPESLITGKR